MKLKLGDVVKCNDALSKCDIGIILSRDKDMLDKQWYRIFWFNEKIIMSSPINLLDKKIYLCFIWIYGSKKI